jgi:flagellar hook-associated protein 2
MGTIISSGVGSGLDVAGLVAKLVEAEGRPQSVRLDAQEAKAQGKLSALGTLRSALDSFRSSLAALADVDQFRGRQVALSNPDFVTATASSASSPGSYAIEVERLAQAHKLASPSYASKDEIIGTGTLTITSGAKAVSVVIDSSNNTLAGIAAAVNDAASNAGIAATVITGVDGSRLVLGATETGLANRIVATQSGGDGGLAALVYDAAGPAEQNQLTELTAAQDARVLIDGFGAESSSNTISGAIDGVDIDLLAANEIGETTLISVGFDRDEARNTIDELVKSYNSLVDAVSSAVGFDAETRQSGPLSGDASLRSILFRLRTELTAEVRGLDGPFSLLSQIGVTTDLDGKLSIDATRLDEAFATDFDAIGELFSAEGTGVALRLDQLLEPYLAAGGVFDSRTDGLKATVEDIGDRRVALEQRLTAVEERLLRQFNALDGLLAQLQTTSNFLSQQLSQLPGVQLFDRD